MVIVNSVGGTINTNQCVQTPSLPYAKKVPLQQLPLEATEGTDVTSCNLHNITTTTRTKWHNKVSTAMNEWMGRTQTSMAELNYDQNGTNINVYTQLTNDKVLRNVSNMSFDASLFILFWSQFTRQQVTTQNVRFVDLTVSAIYCMCISTLLSINNHFELYCWNK